MNDDATRPGPKHVTPGGDEALVRRLREHDREAFGILVQRHSGSLLRIAQNLVRDRMVAEEVVQEAWLGALTGIDSFEARSSLRTWLIQIVVNKARTRLVREGRTVPFSSLAGPGERSESAVDLDRFDNSGAWREPPMPWTTEDPERLALGAETRSAIEAAIEGLPEAQRTVMTLRDIEGLGTDEICNLLGITVTNQRVLLHRARAKVRQALEDRLGGMK